MGAAQESDGPSVFLGFCERRLPGSASGWGGRIALGPMLIWVSKGILARCGGGQSHTAWQAAKALNIRRGSGFQPAMAAFVPPSGSTPARTPALPARGPLHDRRSSQNRREPKRNASLAEQRPAFAKRSAPGHARGTGMLRLPPWNRARLRGSDRRRRIPEGEKSLSTFTG